LAATILSHEVVFLQARDTGVVRGLSVAVGLAAFFQMKLGPSSQLGCFGGRLTDTAIVGETRGVA